MKGLLIEVLVSVALISLALTTALATQLASSLQLNAVREQAIATRLLWDATNQFYAQTETSVWATAWQQHVANDLPQGVGQINQNQVTVSWYNHLKHQQQIMSVNI